MIYERSKMPLVKEIISNFELVIKGVKFFKIRFCFINILFRITILIKYLRIVQNISNADKDRNSFEMWAKGPDGKDFRTMIIEYVRKK